MGFAKRLINYIQISFFVPHIRFVLVREGDFYAPNMYIKSFHISILEHQASCKKSKQTKQTLTSKLYPLSSEHYLSFNSYKMLTLSSKLHCTLVTSIFQSLELLYNTLAVVSNYDHSFLKKPFEQKNHYQLPLYLCISPIAIFVDKNAYKNRVANL